MPFITLLRSRTAVRSLAALSLALGLASPASAALFNFSWTGNPALDPGLTSSADATASVLGTIDLNVGAGQSFTAAQVLDYELTLSGIDGTFVFEPGPVGIIVAGTVAADGLTASLTDLYLASGQSRFGCDKTDGSCGVSGAGFQIVYRFGGGLVRDFRYSSNTEARDSFVLTAAPAVVPTPGTLPLAALALGAMAWSVRRRA